MVLVKIIVERFVQLLNVPDSNVVNLEGNVIDVNELHPKNVPDNVNPLLELAFSSKTTLVKLKQLLKVLYIYVRLGDISI